MLGAPRRFAVLFITIAGFLAILFITSFRTTAESASHPLHPGSNRGSGGTKSVSELDLSAATLSGHVIAPKLGNETAKQELGRASWKLFHTMFARFPDKPTEDESKALESYIYLFQRLYPCGECASHFGQILSKYPPQVTSRSTAAAWGCHVHNEVNKSLRKPIFDCANIGDFYDCGCADGDGTEAKGKTSSEKPEMSDERKEKIAANGRDFDEDLLSGERKLPQVKKEGCVDSGDKCEVSW